MATDPMLRPGRRRRMPALPVALWAAAAVAATAIATIVITASVGSGGSALSPEEVARALAADDTSTTTSTGVESTSTGTSTPTPSLANDDGGTGSQVLGTSGGTVVASCDGSIATLKSWSPDPGYRADDVVRGPAPRVSVWFESEVADDFKVIITCPDGSPKAEERVEFDDHGESDDHGGEDDSGAGSGSYGGSSSGRG